MPAPTTAAELVELIRKSGLIEPARLSAHLAAHPWADRPPAAVCARLVAAGLLTAFHTEQLLRGKYRGFFLGRYKFLDRIGLGGMGQVFLAEHTAMRRRVAVKVMPPDRTGNPYSRERFMREARAAGALDHPNLVRAFDVDQDGETVFLVMEYVDGVSLHDLVTKHGPLAPGRAAHYLAQAAAGLAYLADRGLIHRDIKPANLLVDRSGVVKLLDLGLVRSESDVDELTRMEGVKILGTADYLAPEQAIDCSRVDVRADIYSLGATGYFLLTGRPPFDGTRVAQKLIAHQTRPVTPAHTVRPGIPPALSAVVQRMLAKDPAERFQSPAEVVAALRPWCEVSAPPTDEELAGAGTRAGTVDLNPGGPSAARSGSSSGLRAGAPTVATGSGSAIHYHSDTHRRPDAAAGSSAAMPRPTPAVAPAPPARPAAATHAAALAAPPWADEEEPAERPGGRFRRRLAVALALALALAVGLWDVAVLAGTAPRPVAKPSPAAEPAAPAE